MDVLSREKSNFFDVIVTFRRNHSAFYLYLPIKRTSLITRTLPFRLLFAKIFKCSLMMLSRGVLIPHYIKTDSTTFVPYMPLEQIHLRLSDSDWNASVCKTVGVLRAGGVAVVPTDTVYGLAVRLADFQAVNSLIELKGRRKNHPFALAFPSIEAMIDFCTQMDPLAMRFARRCLPGPVSLVLEMPPTSLLWSLPPEIRGAVSLQSAVCCRVPDHPFLLSVLEELNEPIVLTSANRTGQEESTSVEQILAELGGGIDLLLDAGPLVLPKPSTIVKITGTHYTVLREGALTLETIKKLIEKSTSG